MVLAKSVWPIHDCSVRKSTPPHRCRVANVALNLCNQKSPESKPARFATALQQSSRSSFGLHPAVGNSRLHVRVSDFAFHSFNAATNLSGIGISRSLYAFGVLLR